MDECKHEETEILESDLIDVSKFGATLLLEVEECTECKKRWVNPYLGLNQLSLDDPMLITKEDGRLPSLEYIEKVLGIKKKNIPKELLEEIG